ncbi:NusG domain II-containing protein [Ruminococcaceae bacterium OttesenSCG-928-D13]|nr:NusG domain II-containing protein [Ruminococcaceae bacterium OttesenSCG-928-D13]
MQNQTETEKSNGQPPIPFWRRVDVWAIGVLLLCAVAWLLLSRPWRSGVVAVVSIATAAVEETVEIALDEDGVLHFDEGDLPVHLEVKDGAIRFVDSVCPDHLCENYGWLSREGEWALCAPAGVLVSVRAEA